MRDVSEYDPVANAKSSTQEEPLAALAEKYIGFHKLDKVSIVCVVMELPNINIFLIGRKGESSTADIYNL